MTAMRLTNTFLRCRNAALSDDHLVVNPRLFAPIQYYGRLVKHCSLGMLKKGLRTGGGTTRPCHSISGSLQYSTRAAGCHSTVASCVSYIYKHMYMYKSSGHCARRAEARSGGTIHTGGPVLCDARHTHSAAEAAKQTYIIPPCGCVSIHIHMSIYRTDVQYAGTQVCYSQVRERLAFMPWAFHRQGNDASKQFTIYSLHMTFVAHL